jgi:hypothetical protein
MLDLSVWALAIEASGSEASNNDAIASFGEKVRGMVDLVWVGGGQVRR